MMTNKLETHAAEIRRQIVTMIYNAQSSHMGCSLGIVDILVVLYFKIMHIDPQKPKLEDRDKFVLSKGHACAALYATLAERGYFNKQKLAEYCKNGSTMAGHVTYGSLPGIESTAGSLGHGLSMAVGMALAGKYNKKPTNVYVLVGDGECAEGSIWEAILFAGHHKLHNLTLIIDNNDFQIMGQVSNILDLSPLDKKLDSFGWDNIIIDGNNIEEIVASLEKKHPTKPLAIIAKTIKGKGISFMENKCEWHGKSPTTQEYELALRELNL